MAYLDVQEKVKAAQTSTDPASTSGESDDLAAAKEMGFDPKEYAWVKQQILAASNSETAAREVRARLERSERWNQGGVDFSKAEIRKVLDEATDEQTRKAYADMLANYDVFKAEQMKYLAAEQDQPLVYNRQLISGFACRPAAPIPGMDYRGVDEPVPPPCLVMPRFE
jgi:hypothetical protein